ncbi:Rqc2 family fibronectin-binding protein [Dehalobacterium formicoaceticum]|uniref:Rqc2 family fibronectin-binding protein n=1 Tax=Dehalobacterium formicoaceticum TaxID=51515 RepID=UPI0031F6A51A
MPFDGLVMCTIQKELTDKIIFGKIVKIYQPERHTVLFKIRKGADSHQLLISAHPLAGRIHLTTDTKENPMTPPMFCMVLRKHLEGGRIIAIEQQGLDRVLHLSVEAYDEIGQLSKKTLVVEIMGKHSNILLIDPENNTVLDGIKRYTHLVSRHREVLPGRTYIAPPEQQKLDPFTINEETFAQTLLALPLNTKVKKGLVQILAGFSPLLAQEIIYRAQLPESTIIDELGEYELIRLWQAQNEITAPFSNQQFQPNVALDGDKPIDFSFISLLQFGQYRLLEFPQMSEALDFFFRRQEQSELFSARQRELIKVVGNETERVEKKLALQREKLLETEEMDYYRLLGDLITANMYQLSKGMDEAVLDNLYEPGKTLRVTLNPTFSPAENAQFYYKKYNKAKSSKILIEKQMQKNQEELDYLFSVLTSLEQSQNTNDLEEIRNELVEASYLKEKHTRKKPKNKSTPAPPHTFYTQDNYTILVGKNNKQNDLLTLKMARKDDLWLHTKSIPGSHVIIRRKPGEEIPFAVIEEAARLAAYHSKARNSAQVPVDYTLVSQVKKPSGAKPGMVIYFEQKTLFVTPEQSDSLKQEQEQDEQN